MMIYSGEQIMETSHFIKFSYIFGPKSCLLINKLYTGRFAISKIKNAFICTCILPKGTLN